MSTTFAAIPSDAQPEPVVAAPAPVAMPQATDEWWNTPDPLEPQTPAAPQAPTANDWFLRSSDGRIVYRTADDAIRGMSEKDRVIEQQKAELAQYRQQFSSAAAIPQTPSAPQTPQTPQTAAAHQGLVAALARAVEQKDMTFDQAMSTFVQQQSQAAMQPLQPFLEYAAINKAMDEATRIDPNIPAFVRSQAYAKTLDKWPGLKTVIKVASSAPHMQTADGRTYGEMLPEFLAQAYMVAKAAAPAAQAVQRPAPQSATPPQVVRPGSPQNLPYTPQPQQGGFRDTFAEAWANVPDIALTRESLGG